jgi:hypothetical protein
MAIVKGNNNKCWSGSVKTGTFIHCWWECKLVQPLWKAVWRFLKKLEMEQPYDKVMPFLGIYPTKHKSEYNGDTYTLKLITALFTIAKLWKQPRCPTTDEQIKKLWYMYTMALYSVIKNNDMWFEGKWMQLEDIV